MQQRPQLVLHPLQALALQVVVGQQVIPQYVARVTDQQARQHAAHAVADVDHVLRCTRAAVGIEVLQRVVECIGDLVAVQRDRRIGRVVDLPHLELLAQLGVAHDLVGQVHPGFRAAGQAVQHEDDATIRVPRLHQVDVRFADALAHAEQGAQRLPGETALRQPQAIGGGEVAGQRHLLAMQGDALGGFGRISVQLDPARAHHIVQVAALEAQQCGDVDRRHLAELGHRIVMAMTAATACVVLILLRCLGLGALGCDHRCNQLRRVHHHHQLGTEAIAAIGTAQADEADRAGRHQLRGNALQVQLLVVGGQRPAADRERLRVVLAGQRSGACAHEQHHCRLLGRVVVIVAHLRLAVLEGTVGR